MVSPKKIHQWVIKALEEPFVRAELHRANMSLPDAEKPRLQLHMGERESKNNNDAIEIGEARS